MHSKLLSLIQPDNERLLREVLSDVVIFHSPVRDYSGITDVAHIMSTIGRVLDDVTPQRELTDRGETLTFLTASYHGHVMDGVLDETYDQLGRVERATLLLRPLSALLKAIDGMRVALTTNTHPRSTDPPPSH